MPDATPDLNDSETADPALRSRTIYYTDPFLSAGKVRVLSGLDALRAMWAGEIPGAPIGALMNVRIIEVEESRVVLEGTAG